MEELSQAEAELEIDVLKAKIGNLESKIENLESKIENDRKHGEPIFGEERKKLINLY